VAEASWAGQSSSFAQSVDSGWIPDQNLETNFDIVDRFLQSDSAMMQVLLLNLVLVVAQPGTELELEARNFATGFPHKSYIIMSSMNPMNH
jgi:hypothetical protein